MKLGKLYPLLHIFTQHFKSLLTLKYLYFQMKKNYLLHLLLFSLLYPGLLWAKNDSKDYLQKAESTLPKQCLFYFKMYLHAKGSKAFAYAIDSKERLTCRFSASSKNQKKANSVAIASCQKSANEKGIQSKCKIYQIDKHLAKTNKQLHFENKYLINLKNIRPEKREKTGGKQKKKILTQKDTSTLPKQCLMFYHLYEEAEAYKAFAISIENDKKYVCKYSAGSENIKKAKEVAITSCEKTRLKRGIKKPCILFTPKKQQIKQIIKKKKTVAASPALEKAILSANLTKIKALIKNGADINGEASDKSRALFVAVAQGDINYAKELIKRGAFVFIKKKDGNNLLVAAIMSGNNKILRLMLEQKINPNIPCEEGNTPLHFAFMMFDDKMMKTLYSFAARDDIKNNKGKSVQDLAKEFHIDLKRLKR